MISDLGDYLLLDLGSKSGSFDPNCVPNMCICLPDRDCCSSATEEFLIPKNNNPNPSYLHFGSIPRPWDTKILSSHIEKAGIEILRARVDCKSDETQGLRPAEHMNIFTKNTFLALKGVVLYSSNIIIHVDGPRGKHFRKMPN